MGRLRYIWSMVPAQIKSLNSKECWYICSSLQLNQHPTLCLQAPVLLNLVIPFVIGIIIIMRTSRTNVFTTEPALKSSNDL